MKAIVLAAGEGLRLRPFTLTKPKGMISVGNKPLLEYVLKALADAGLRDIVMVVGYAKERIMNHFGNGKEFGVSITYVEQKRQLGTAHAILQARNLVDGEFMVLPGDNLVDATLIRDLLDNHGKVSLALTTSATPSKYGVVSLEGNIVRELTEKPKVAFSNIISTGVYVFPAQIFAIIEEMLNQSRPNITDALKHILENNLENIVGVMSRGLWCDMVYPWDILRMNFEAVTRSSGATGGTFEENVVMKGKVIVGKGSLIRSGCYIEGPVVIGAGCDIGPNAIIYPSTSIGDDCTIGPFTHIVNSVIYSSCSIGPHSHLSNSIVGEGSTIMSHFSAPSSTAHVYHDGEYHQVENIGALIGEDTRIGTRVAIDSGTIIGSKCIIMPPNCNVRRNLDSGSRWG